MKNKRIHAEVSLNQIVGIIGGWLIVYITQPLFIKYKLSSEEIATLYSILFFMWSYSRSYLIRLYFEGKIKNDK